MNKTAFLLGIGCALLLSGCDGAGVGGTDKRIADLEKRVAAAQDQNRDLRVKMRLIQSFDNSPLQDFFAADEFWQCTYDSAWSDCSSRCAKEAAAQRAECPKKSGAAAQQACYEAAAARVARCVDNCPVQMSPLGPPNCARGGSGIM